MYNKFVIKINADYADFHQFHQGQDVAQLPQSSYYSQ